MKYTEAPHTIAPMMDEQCRELEYLRKVGEHTAAKILLLDTQSIAMRHELEQKRRGFGLIAELAVTLAKDGDYASMFLQASRRINAALNMQRTAVLTPVGDGTFIPLVLQGYPTEEEAVIATRRIRVPREFQNADSPALVTGADPGELFRAFRDDLVLPYFIACPILLHNEIAAILVTGRTIEQIPFLTRLGPGDVETVQTVSSFLAAMLAGRRMAEAEERTQIMLDAMPLCCSFWDENFNNIDCNEEAARLFGLSSKQEYLDRFMELSPEYQPDGRRSFEAAQEKIRTAFVTGYARFEWLHQKPNGERIPAEISLVRVKRGEGHIVAGYTRDLREQKAMLTEMRKTEDELRLARDLAEKNARAKSEFLANMSHEIRTPMNAIIGMNHLLADTELSAKQRDYVEKAGHSANLLLRVINDILDFSKIDAGKMEMERIPFSIRKILRNVSDMVMPHVKEKSLKLQINIGRDIPDMLTGDPIRIEQVLLNLAGNAVKFTRHGAVSISVSADTALQEQLKLRFNVEDTGIGMSEEQVACLFKPFVQADTSTTRKYGGTGLGLAISRSLVHLMDGEIWCNSVPGKGSRFSFELPFVLAEKTAGKSAVEEGEPEQRAIRDTDAECASLGGLRVLLAEDNEINQMIAMELLSSRDIVVTAVSNGQEALDALNREPFDIVLMDIQMPEMDGLTATARLRADARFVDLPVIAMTAHAMVGDREISLEGGMNDHVTKPIDPQILYATLRRWDKRRK